MTTNQNTQAIHDLTKAEIDRQLRMLAERHRQIINERAAVYKAVMKTGVFQTVAIDADERAAREHAKNLLNGAAPQDLLSLPVDLSRDRILLREQRGIEIAMGILSQKELVARAVEAVAWGEANRAELNSDAREMVLARVRMDAAEARFRSRIEQCPDIFAVRLPMGNLISGALSVAEIPLNDLVEAAVADGLTTQAEVRKAAKNAG